MKEPIHSRIKEIRIRHNLSQGEFAERLNTTRGNISQIELGNQLPTLKFLSGIVRYFNVNYEWLIDGDTDEGGFSSGDNADVLQQVNDKAEEYQVKNKNKVSRPCVECLVKERLIKSQRETIEALQDTLKALKARIRDLENK